MDRASGFYPDGWGFESLAAGIPFEYYMTFIPFQHRPPQKYLRTEHRRFEFSHGSGIEVIDHYLDKNKKTTRNDYSSYMG